MSKKCPNCLEMYDDNHGFCSNCGSRLVDCFEDLVSDPVLNLGDANAITGGVNINRSKNITSHDTHYHSTTVHERTKSDSELRLEATNQLRCKAEEIISERGRIDSVAMTQLRPFATQLGIDDETFKSIIKDVRSNRNGSSSGLSAANARYLLQAQQAVQTNDMDSLSNLTPRLEAMAAISQDDNVQYLYYLTLSLLYPLKSMEVFEHQTDENYWRSFWAIISYIRTGKHTEATKVLALFEPIRFEKSEEDQNLLEAYFNIMKEDKDGAQEFLDEILGEPSEPLKPLLRAIEIALYEEDADNLNVRFYYERVLTKSDVVIKTSKKVESSVSAEEYKGILVEANNSPKIVVQKESVPTVNIIDHKSDTSIESIYAEACSASGPKRVMLLQKAAEAGFTDAMYDLADCYADGEGVAKNEELAIKWLTKAADHGHSLAQTTLGGLYFMGMSGVEQSYTLSEKYLKLAANKNVVEAQAFLSQLYVNIEEYTQAIVWARKAAQASNPEAYNVLGQIYLNGLGVDTNPIEGLMWYEKAAEKGDADAQNIVGNIYSNQDLNVLDLNKAFKYYQMSATQNHLYGMFNFGLCYATGDGCKVDISKAIEWIEKAANEGCSEAQEWLDNNACFDNDYADNSINLSTMTSDEEISYAIEAISNNDESKAKDSVAILKKYVNQDEPSAQYNLALCYHLGYGVKQNYQVAASWLNKSAKLGFAPSMYQLGEKYKEGHGCTVNIEEAAKWYRKAANLGMPEAQFSLGQLYIKGDGVTANEKKGINLIKEAAAQNLTEALEWLKNNALPSNSDPNSVKSTSKQLNTNKKDCSFKIESIDITTDGRKELYIDIKWSGDKKLVDWLEIDILGSNREFIDNKFDPNNKLRFVLTEAMLKLKTRQINKLTFYVEMYDRVYKEDGQGEYIKNNLLVAKGPIKVNVYFEFHIFGKNVMEIRK